MDESLMLRPGRLPEEARDIARRAADLIENVGWCQNRIAERDDDGEYIGYCPEGALRVAQWGTVSLTRDEVDNPINRMLWKACTEILLERGFHGRRAYVTGWNDMKERTAEEAVAFLRDLAEWQGEVTCR